MSPHQLPLLTIREAARRLKVSQKRVYHLIQNGRLHSIRISARGLRIPEHALLEYMEQLAAARRQELQNSCR